MNSPTRRRVAEDKSWVLAPLLELPHVIHAAVISGDGFIEGSSPGLKRDSAEGVAAMMSALQGRAGPSPRRSPRRTTPGCGRP